MPNCQFTRPLQLLTVTLLLISGCSSRPAAYSVSGTVKSSKESVEGVLVALAPVDSKVGAPSSGIVGKDGSFSLKTGDGRSGAEAGKYKVVLTLGTEATQQAMAKAMQKAMAGGARGGSKGPPKFEYPFPSEYADAKTSPKEVEITSGSNIINIDF